MLEPRLAFTLCTNSRSGRASRSPKGQPLDHRANESDWPDAEAFSITVFQIVRTLVKIPSQVLWDVGGMRWVHVARGDNEITSEARCPSGDVSDLALRARRSASEALAVLTRTTLWFMGKNYHLCSF